jgi:hypothetical protein
MHSFGRLSTDTRHPVYGYLTAMCIKLDNHKFNCILTVVFAASMLADDFSMCILECKLGGCIGSIAVK